VYIGSSNPQSKLLEDLRISVLINLRILRLCLMILPRLLVGNFSSIIQLQALIQSNPMSGAFFSEFLRGCR